MKRIVYKIVVALLFVMVVSGCNKNGNNVFLEKVGEISGKTVNSLGRIANIKIGNNGDIYILDVSDNKITVLDSTGRYKFSFGKKGNAPGEMLAPRQMGIGNDNHIFISDIYAHRIDIFDSTGKYVNFIGNVNNPTLVVTKDMVIIPNSDGKQLLGFYDYSGKLLYKGGEKTALSPKKTAECGSKYDRIHAMAIRGDTIYLSFEYNYIIGKYDMKGNRISEIVPPKKIRDIPPAKVSGSSFTVNYMPFSLLMTSNGYILHWVYENKIKTQDRKKPHYYFYCDIFGQNGKFLKRIPGKSVGWCIDRHGNIYMPSFVKDTVKIEKYQLKVGK